MNPSVGMLLIADAHDLYSPCRLPQRHLLIAGAAASAAAAICTLCNACCAQHHPPVPQPSQEVLREEEQLSLRASASCGALPWLRGGHDGPHRLTM